MEEVHNHPVIYDFFIAIWLYNHQEGGDHAMTNDQLNAVFGALADPTRRAILARLALGDATVTELNEPFSMSQPAISKHLKVLERARLISRHRNATMRLSHLEAEPLKQATDWLANYRAYWEASYARLDDLLQTMNTPGTDTSTKGSSQ